jgi:hypothetical protein
MSNLRLGDVIDDFCVKCRRLTNHSIVSLIEGEAAKVRCRTCYSDHDYRREQAPPSKKDLKKAELFNQVLTASAPAAAPSADGVSTDGANADPLQDHPPADSETQEAVASGAKKGRKKKS